MSSHQESAGAVSPTSPSVSSGADRIFFAFVFLLAALSLVPILGFRFLPMQDYPQHLFLSHVTATFDNSAFNWPTFYRVDLGLRPYMLWYLMMKPLAVAFGVEVAGKMLFAGYIALVTAVVVATRRIAGSSFLPWGALLLYPFSFNQMYFMGFSNYLLSLPFLFILLLDLEKALSHPLHPSRLALHACGLLLLLLNHPYTVLVYIALAVAAAVCSRPPVATAAKALSPAIATAVVFGVWYAFMHGPSSAPTAYTWGISWWPVAGTIGYYLLMFTGMKLSGHAGWGTAAVWSLCFAFAGMSWYGKGKVTSELRFPLVLFMASLSGFLILPFWFGYYSYFNLRLAPVSYFAAALVLSRLRLGTASGIAVASCSAVLILFSVRTQAYVSSEAATILPVVAKMERNAKVLPLVFDGSSQHLDPVYFYQVHAHEADYYHIVKGGGANPNLFPNAMMPVQYRPGINLPAPAAPSQFQLSQYGHFYDYLLVRHPPPNFTTMLLESGCHLLAASQHWQLFSLESFKP